MAYRFVQSFHDLGPRKGPVRGFVIHMAEGGGTVGYLAKWNPNGVSVHYVIEYDGEIVQMLREDHMHGSIRASNIRTSDDPDRFFGATAARAVLGDWARIATTLGPNHASIAVEVEGFAATGPNPAQKTALGRLVADVRTRYDLVGLLGHRDFADYKACPGRLIPWTALGGHGVFAAPSEDLVKAFPVPERPMLAAVKSGAWLYDNSDLQPSAGNVQISSDRQFPYVGIPSGKRAVAYDPPAGDTNASATAMWVRDVDIAGYSEPQAPLPVPQDCTDEVRAAIETTKASARVVFG